MAPPKGSRHEEEQVQRRTDRQDIEGSGPGFRRQCGEAPWRQRGIDLRLAQAIRRNGQQRCEATQSARVREHATEEDGR